MSRLYAAAFCILSISTHYYLNDQKEDLNNTNQLSEKQSQMMESGSEKVSALLSKEKEVESSTDEVELQHLKNFRSLNQKNDQHEYDTNQNFVKQSERTEAELEGVTSPLTEEQKSHQEDAQSLDLPVTEVIFYQDLFILPVQLLRDGLVSVRPSSHSEILVVFLVELAFGFAVTGIVVKKLKKKVVDLEKKVSQLQSDSQNRENGHESLVETLTEVKAELDIQRDQLKQKLEEVEREMEENKLKLQEVETEIKKETTFKENEELVRKKENLLQEEWVLEQKKRDVRSQVQNIEKLYELAEVHVSRLHPKQQA